MNNLKTFTKDSVYGVENEELKPMCKEYEEKLKGVISHYAKDCIAMNIESSSAQGMLFMLVFNCFNEALLIEGCKRIK